jgi:CubicO group peptidase (beta-lactamase class C family)
MRGKDGLQRIMPVAVDPERVVGTPIDRRTLLARLAAFGWVLSTSCARQQTRGFDAEGLDELRHRLERQVEAGFAPGVVGLVAHGSHVETFALGKMAFGGADMGRDTIFRIASMTKAVTATAVMMLVEEGKFRLDEPVDRLLPELADRRVLRRLDAELDDTVPARRPITVEDLLTFRCGLGLILAPPGTYPIQRAITDLGIVGFGPPDPAMPFDGDAWIQKLGSLPLLAQPGEDWLYTAGSNIQGVLVARASGQPLSRFFEERIFGPLGMKDTAFFVPPAKIDRLAHAYRSQDGTLVVSDEPATGKWSRPPTFEQGDGGLVSTVDDYLAFARMVLADGRHQGQTLLAPDSVKAMKTNHLTETQRAGGEMILGRGRGWGYGMSVVTDAVSGQPAPGTFGWVGGYGSSWITDPVRDLTAILMTQHEFMSASGDPIHQDFRDDAYRALR